MLHSVSVPDMDWDRWAPDTLDTLDRPVPEPEPDNPTVMAGRQLGQLVLHTDRSVADMPTATAQWREPSAAWFGQACGCLAVPMDY